ncbi:hypothetical protein BSKO_06625 [Bryopsis sp. KO-2023]|nr:hypothetical protein BSKO_06625 [Bryopsis sp. KO-2023]
MASTKYSTQPLASFFRRNLPPVRAWTPTKKVKARLRATSIEEWDVVALEFVDAGRKTERLGRVSYVSNQNVDVDWLIEEAPGIWVLDPDTPPKTVSTENVLRTIDHEYSQRIEQDRISNPHGEHAEEVWEIFDL